MIDSSLFETARMVLRPPDARDAQAIFDRYSSDPEVTRFVGWPRHRSAADTQRFLEFSRSEWSHWPVGPLLCISRKNGELLGATGLAFETPSRASTGFVLARDAWGLGYATEALGAMQSIARTAGIRRLYALCHVENDASIRVLERGSFKREGRLARHAIFPNSGWDDPQDVWCYARTW